MGTTLAERRMALRLSREQAGIELPETDEEVVVSLPSVRKALGTQQPNPEPEEPELPGALETGDDDDADLEDLVDEDDFYADALEDV